MTLAHASAADCLNQTRALVDHIKATPGTWYGPLPYNRARVAIETNQSLANAVFGVLTSQSAATQACRNKVTALLNGWDHLPVGHLEGMINTPPNIAEAEVLVRLHACGYTQANLIKAVNELPHATSEAFLRTVFVLRNSAPEKPTDQPSIADALAFVQCLREGKPYAGWPISNKESMVVLLAQAWKSHRPLGNTDPEERAAMSAALGQLATPADALDVLLASLDVSCKASSPVARSKRRPG